LFSKFRDATFLSAQRFRYAIPKFWKIKKLFDIGSERRLRESISTVHQFADQIIRFRKKDKQTDEKHDLLSRFVASSENYSDKFLRDIVISFLLAGRETTSSALSWFFWILSSRPDVEAKILDEIRSVRAKNVGSETCGYDFEELKEMHYLHAAISESMRLYPPVPVNSAQVLKDDVLPDGTKIWKGWFMLYNAYAMGRMEANWGKDCMEYRPERWIDTNGTFQQESPFKFTAFHAGPRMCLGKEMAYVQMKSVVAFILDRFVLKVEGNGRCPEKIVSLTLRMKGGLPVHVRERSC
jgi:cytochrome P450